MCRAIDRSLHSISSLPGCQLAVESGTVTGMLLKKTNPGKKDVSSSWPAERGEGRESFLVSYPEVRKQKKTSKHDAACVRRACVRALF